jgi:predicted CopG family antitoxin
MQKKLTVTVDEEVYEGLRRTIGPRKISRFIQELVRPHVVRPNLESAYAEMAMDKEREEEAMEWAETTFKDVAHETA